jgi:hypothetical protein
MKRSEFSTARIVGLLILGIFLFSPPFILIFDKPVLVAGIPMLFLYLVVAWAVLVALMMFVIEHTEVNSEHTEVNSEQERSIQAAKKESSGVTGASGEKT